MKNETTLKQKDQTLTQIAKKELCLETLETRNNDCQDFHDLAVWEIKAALEAAYKSGQQSANKSC